MVEREKSCGAIVFRKNKEIKYLLLYKKASDHYREAWDFPKGNVEKGETAQEVAAREVEEEAGIKAIAFIEGFKERIKFFYRREGQLVHKEIIFLVAQTTQSKVKLSYEHQGYEWASYDKALRLLTHKNSKAILTKAQLFLQKKFKQQTLV